MNKPILIVGAGPAGLAAAHSLGAIGQRVVLVEKEAKLGGAPILSGYAKLVPSGEWARDAIGGMVRRVEESELVLVQKSKRVEKFAGEPGGAASDNQHRRRHGRFAIGMKPGPEVIMRRGS